MAKVQLKCFSFTEAYACVSVTATAEAWAEATADAHASAVSSAVAGCGCLTEAVTDSFSDASTYLKLVAKAASTATATACLDGAHSPPCTSVLYSLVPLDSTIRDLLGLFFRYQIEQSRQGCRTLMHLRMPDNVWGSCMAWGCRPTPPRHSTCSFGVCMWVSRSPLQQSEFCDALWYLILPFPNLSSGDVRCKLGNSVFVECRQGLRDSVCLRQLCDPCVWQGVCGGAPRPPTFLSPSNLSALLCRSAAEWFPCT